MSNGAERSRRETVAQLSFRRRITTVLSSERAGVKKPDPRVFTKAATELGLANSQSVFVGDHPLNDVEGALLSGMRAIWLQGFHCWPDRLAATVPAASSLAEVGNHIARTSGVR
ncbi:HAD family hydrolase [Variovorax gossypii]